MTLAGTAVAVFATALAVVALTGGCGDPTDTRHYDEPRAVVAPPPVLHLGDSVTRGSS